MALCALMMAAGASPGAARDAVASLNGVSGCPVRLRGALGAVHPARRRLGKNPDYPGKSYY